MIKFKLRNPWRCIIRHIRSGNLYEVSLDRRKGISLARAATAQIVIALKLQRLPSVTLERGANRLFARDGMDPLEELNSPLSGHERAVLGALNEGAEIAPHWRM